MKKGEKYECIKTVVMEEGDIDYVKGNIYLCEEDGCLTDEDGDTGHSWSGLATNRHFKKIDNVSAIDFVAYTRDKAKRAAAIDYLHTGEPYGMLRELMANIEERIEMAYIAGYENGYRSAESERVGILK